MLDCGAVITGGIEGVGHCPQGQRLGFLAAQAFGDEHRSFGQVKRFFRAYADSLDDELGELFNRRLAD